MQSQTVTWVQVIQICLQSLGVLTAIGFVGWLLKRIRRAELIVDVEYVPSSVPSGWLNELVPMMQVVKTMVVPEANSDESNIKLRRNIEASKLALQKSFNKTLLEESWHFDGRIDKLVVDFHNKSPHPLKAIHLFVEEIDFLGGIRGSAFDLLCDVALAGPFLTAQQRMAFGAQILQRANAVLPELPDIPPRSTLRLELFGKIARDHKLNIQCEPHMKWRMRRVIRAPLNPTIIAIYPPWNNIMLGALAMALILIGVLALAFVINYIRRVT